MKPLMLTAAMAIALATQNAQAQEANWCEDSPAKTVTCVVGGLLVLGLLMGGGGKASADGSYTDETRSSGMDSQGQQFRYDDTTPSASSGSSEDTSVGCAWGDRAYGTCH